MKTEKSFANTLELLAAHLLMALASIVTLGGNLVLNHWGVSLRNQTIWGIAGMGLIGVIMWVTLQSSRSVRKSFASILLVIVLTYIGMFVAFGPYLFQ